MIAPTARRLPGIRFEVQSPPPAMVLPRMDIAVLVGFAASGPLNRPIAVEEVAEFEAIFGADLPLAWDEAHGEMVDAYLAPAVRAFFRNGGKRCWIIRVARDPTTNHFQIPGLASAQFDAQGQVLAITPAFAQARSPGSWSDPWRVSATLLTQTIVVQAHHLPDLAFDLELASPQDLNPGDLLRLSFENKYVLQLAVASIEPIPTSPVSSTSVRVTGDKAVWLAHGGVKLPSTDTGLATLYHSSAPRQVHATWVPDPSSSPVEPSDEMTFTLDLDARADAPELGSLLCVQLGGDELWLRVQSLNAEADAGSPPAKRMQVSGQAWWRLTSAPSLAADSIPDGEVLTFELWARQGDEYLTRLTDLGFEMRHPRCWDALPTDDQLYPEPDKPPAQPSALWQAAANPRFPFAGRADEHVLYLPIGMPPLPDYFLGADPLPTTALDRDGLSHFDASLFLDPAFDDVGVLNLLARADYIRYQSFKPRALTGIHAALSIEEATLIAVPDAIHRGWNPEPPRPLAQPMPAQPWPHPEWWRWMDCDPRSPIPPAPNPAWEHFLNCDTYEKIIPAPTLDQPAPEVGGTFTLTWTGTGRANAKYFLQESPLPDYKDAKDTYCGPDRSYELYGRSVGDYYYRVRETIDGYSSDWSNGVVVRVAPGARSVQTIVQDYDNGVLLRVQRALLRMSAARGDLFAVLALPEHYREDDAVAHYAALTRPIVDAAGADDDRTFSFGALYHPWLFGREENEPDQIRRTPPDGAACGILARRAIQRGAWVAPANELFEGVIALSPSLHRERFLDLQDAHINVIRQEPRGFITLCGDTSSADDDLRLINVRRLLSLLRRLVAQVGATYVFEPNSDAFRRALQRGFEALLTDLFRRGAFAGKTAATAFQVITDQTVNPPQSIDQGRFIVELGVAPSQPLSFLTVRLVQTGDRSMVMEVQ